MRLVLVDPPAGVNFGIQRGRGAEFALVSIEEGAQPPSCGSEG
jgi:hypothetical protein